MRRAQRSNSARLIAGVAGGLAEHLDLPVRAVRIVLMISILLNGLGLLLYAGCWLVMPIADDADSMDDDRVRGSWWRESSVLIAVTAVLVGVAGLAAAANPGGIGGGLLGLLISAIGALALWLRADISRHSDSWQSDWWLSVVGVSVMAVGLFMAVANQTGWLELVRALLVLIMIAGGVGFGVAPMVIRWKRDRDNEMYAAIRRDEREAVAAHLHDSVLQTLTLIRRKSADANEVNRLARVGESSLREWLYPKEGVGVAGFAASLRAAGAAVESEYPCTIEIVSVGDLMLDEPLSEVLAAAREAMTNAARHSESRAPIQVYAECTELGVEVYVRDRGIGFAHAAVPANRLGIRQSILGRMARLGGTATVDSTPGQGTEVSLRLGVTR